MLSLPLPFSVCCAVMPSVNSKLITFSQSTHKCIILQRAAAASSQLTTSKQIAPHSKTVGGVSRLKAKATPGVVMSCTTLSLLTDITSVTTDMGELSDRMVELSFIHAYNDDTDDEDLVSNSFTTFKSIFADVPLLDLDNRTIAHVEYTSDRVTPVMTTGIWFPDVVEAHKRYTL